MPCLRAAFLVLLLSSAVQADDLLTLSGKKITGSLSGLTDSAITLKTPAGPVETPLAQVLALDLKPVAETKQKHTLVQLVDESQLRCQKIAFDAKEATLTLASGASVKVPISAVNSFLRDAQDPEIRKQWDKQIARKVRKDRVFVMNKSELNPIEGTLGEINAAEQRIAFKPDAGETLQAKLDNLQGLSFYRTDILDGTPVCRVFDVDGGVVVATKLTLEGDNLGVVTMFNAKLAIPQASLARLDFNLGRLTYLSDLDPKVFLSPWYRGFNLVKKDLNLDGNPVRLQDKQYAKALSMYAGTTLEFSLSGKYKDFKAVLGADAAIAEEGQRKVTVTIFCDGEKRFTDVVSPKELRAVAVNVKDINVLRIVVSGENFTGYSGHATLAEARVSQ